MSKKEELIVSTRRLNYIIALYMAAKGLNPDDLAKEMGGVRKITLRVLALQKKTEIPKDDLELIFKWLMEIN